MPVSSPASSPARPGSTRRNASPATSPPRAGRQPARQGGGRAGRRRPAVARHRLRAAAALPRLLVGGRAGGHDGVRGEAAAAVRRPVVCAPHAPSHPRRHRPLGDGRARRPLRRGHGRALRGGAPALPGRDPAGPGAAAREGGAHRVRPRFAGDLARAVVSTGRIPPRRSWTPPRPRTRTSSSWATWA